MKTLFVASGPVEWASARLRCFWPAQYMENAVVVTPAEPHTLKAEAAEADALVFQKIFDVETARAARTQGKRVIWDLCDPVWWFSPKEAAENLKHVDGCTFSCQGLMEDFERWCGGEVSSWCIPDRIKLDQYPLKREHADVSPVRLIWFGLSVNRWAVMSALANLERLAANGHKIELTIMDDRPGPWAVTNSFPIYAVQWSLEKENEVIAAHDLAVLPPYPGPWGEVKSNNRTLTAWACGVPMSSGLYYGELERLVESAAHRRGKVKFCLDTSADYFNILASAREWEAVLCG